MRKGEKYSLLSDRWFRIIVSSGVILLTAAFVILRYEGFFRMLGVLLCTLRPLLLGGLFALVLNRPYRRFLHDFTVLSEKRAKPFPDRQLRCAAITASVLLTLLILTGIVCILLPQLVDSVVMLTENLQFYLSNASGLLTRISGKWLPDGAAAEAQLTALRKELSGILPRLMEKLYTGTAGVLECLLDVGIGAVFSVYLLADSVRLKRQAVQAAERIFRRERTSSLLKTMRLVGTTFERFFTSQLTEALILGVLCLIGMLIFRFPYPLLISVIIGLTNIVPYVGPVVGTIPCMLIILLAEPRMAIWFLIFVVVLQQVESNFIFPRIVGKSVGLPPAWVLAAIIVGGGLFGAAGMLLAVPLTAVIYAVLFGEERESGG
ncbi:MAG: AI-2E family transporter [Oscillospiraceae bacterium]|nr:AI-2E family transporter [Oscillospiraceae bacterium]